jgi:hypothetical protein
LGEEKQEKIMRDEFMKADTEAVCYMGGLNVLHALNGWLLIMAFFVEASTDGWRAAMTTSMTTTCVALIAANIEVLAASFLAVLGASFIPYFLSTLLHAIIQRIPVPIPISLMFFVQAPADKNLFQRTFEPCCSRLKVLMF